MAAAENEQNGVIDLTDNTKVSGGAYTISSAGDHRFTCKENLETSNRIVVNGEKISAEANIYIYLDNVNIKTPANPALQIADNVKAKVTIYLTGTNNLITTDQHSAGLQKNNGAQLIITNASDTATGSLKASGVSGAGIGSGDCGSCDNITINSGFIDAKSEFGAGIGGGYYGSCDNITINSGSVNAESWHSAGIGGGYNGSCNNITINSGSVNAKSVFGAGIGSGYYGSCNNITINSGSVNAESWHSAGIGGANYGSCNNITIDGGSVKASSVKASSVSSSPTNAKGGKVYCCTIENPNSEDVIIDVDGTSTLWKPKNHKAVDQNDKNLYAWLIGKTQTISVGSKKQTYYVDKNSNEFKPITNNDFTLSSANLTYNGTAQAPLECNIEDIKDEIKLSYYENGVLQPNGAINAGTYTVTANIAGNSFADKSWTFTINPATFDENSIEITAYNKIYDGDEHPVITGNFPDGSNVGYSTESPNETTIWSSTCPNVKTVADASNTKVWVKISKDNYTTEIYGPKQATINPAPEAPGYTTQTTIPVPWSCKKINDITKSLPTNWIWSSDVDPNQDLQVGTPITATAIYKGNDKGNYHNEEITYTIIRNECEHKNTVGRYYSSPSCTSNGYSGDTYCNDCERTIYYGSTIPAYGHDYDSGVITTEPTAETDGIITYTCKRCKHQDTKTLGKLGDGEPYIEGSFQKKSWDTVNDLIKTSKEKDTISIIMNGAKVLPASVLSGIKGKDISLNLDMENGFIWKINGTSITAETPADTDLSVTNTAEYIPAALYSLISTNQNDFGFHLGRNGAFDFPAVLSVKADASCAGLMANLFWYDVENGVLQCIQTVTVGGAFERSIPYADFTLSKGQDYFIAFGTESLNGRVIHTDGSITDENGVYLRPADAKISSHSIDRNKLTVKLSKGCAGAQGYDFVISKKSNMLQTGKFSQTVSSTSKPQASFRYLAKGTWYVAARSWVLDAQGNKIYGSWTKIKKIKITVVTPQQPKIKNITVKGNTVTITYTKCKNATGYEILLGNKYKTSAGEKYPVKKHLKRTEGKNTVTVTFTNVKKGTWYVTIRAWNQTSKDKSRVYSPYSTMKKFKTKK